MMPASDNTSGALIKSAVKSLFRHLNDAQALRRNAIVQHLFGVDDGLSPDVTDVLNYEVRILKYPSGDNVTTLGSGDGIQDPFSAVDGPNAVY